MEIILYSFEKRKNSTKIAVGGASYTGTLKNNTSVVRPSIIFEFSTFPAVNYAYIPDFARYYWITDKIQIANNLWELVMHVDVMASYKNEVGRSEKYILRSASSFDGNITDLKYPTKTIVNADVQQTNIFEAGLRYVVGVVDPSNIFSDALTYYSLSPTQFMQLKNVLMGGQNYFGEITDPDIRNFAVVMGNPLQYIKICRAYPVNVPQGLPATMKLGNTDIPNMNILTGQLVTKSFSFNINNHPLYEQRGRYVSWEPFTQRFIYFSPVGLVHISSALFAHFISLNGNIDFDYTTGIGRLVIRTPETRENDASVIYTSDFAFGYDVPMAQLISGNPLKLISSTMNVLSAGYSAVTLNVGGMVQSGASAITDFISANTPEMRGYLDGGGNRLTVSAMNFIEQYYDIADDNNIEYGRPLMKTVPINTLSGYVLCADGEIECDGTETEIAELETFLTGGFFYE